MAFDELQAARIANVLDLKSVVYFTKRMMGGLVYMVDDKMLCGIHYDKKQETDLLMARVGPDVYEKMLEREGCQAMTFTGRTMKGFVFVTPDGYDLDHQLSFWIDRCLDYNPLAKASKKKNKKSNKK